MKVYLWAPELYEHGRVFDLDHDATFMTMAIPEKYEFGIKWNTASFAICPYKTPNGIIYIARQGHNPSPYEMLALWPELKSMFVVDEPVFIGEACLNCNKVMAQNLQHMTFSCSWCGYSITDQALVQYKQFKIEMEKAQKAEVESNEFKQHLEYLTGDEQYIYDDTVDSLYEALQKAKARPDFEYRNKAASEFSEDIVLDPTLWNSDEDAGLL